MRPERHAPRWLRRLGWFAALWTLGVGALGAVALVLRAAVQLAGLPGPGG